MDLPFIFVFVIDRFQLLVQFLNFEIQARNLFHMFHVLFATSYFAESSTLISFPYVKSCILSLFRLIISNSLMFLCSIFVFSLSMFRSICDRWKHAAYSSFLLSR